MRGRLSTVRAQIHDQGGEIVGDVVAVTGHLWCHRVGGARAAGDHGGMIDSPQFDMFFTIVWATDGAVASLAGCDFVREVYERYGSKLLIVHVAPTLCTEADERRIAKLKALTSSLRRHGVDASLHVVHGAVGSPAPHIAQVARMADADRRIVGSAAALRWPERSAEASSSCWCMRLAPCSFSLFRPSRHPAPRTMAQGTPPGCGGLPWPNGGLS